MLASTSAFPFKHINVSELVTEKGFHEGLDEEWNSYTLDEDRVGSPSLSPGTRVRKSHGHLTGYFHLPPFSCWIT